MHSKYSAFGWMSDLWIATFRNCLKFRRFHLFVIEERYFCCQADRDWLVLTKNRNIMRNISFKLIFRSWLRNKTFTVISILSLAVGIACTNLLAAFVIHEYNIEQENPNKVRMVVVKQTISGAGMTGHARSHGISLPSYSSVSRNWIRRAVYILISWLPIVKPERTFSKTSK